MRTVKLDFCIPEHGEDRKRLVLYANMTPSRTSETKSTSLQQEHPSCLAPKESPQFIKSQPSQTKKRKQW